MSRVCKTKTEIHGIESPYLLDHKTNIGTHTWIYYLKPNNCGYLVLCRYEEITVDSA